MNAIPPSFTAEHGAATTAGVRWTALSDAAGIVATLAGADPLADMDEAADFPLRIGNVEPWRQVQAENGIADLAAIMEPGIAALLAVNARGADPRPAAEALWREYRAAREAILALLPPSPDTAPAP